LFKSIPEHKPFSKTGFSGKQKNALVVFIFAALLAGCTLWPETLAQQSPTNNALPPVTPIVLLIPTETTPTPEEIEDVTPTFVPIMVKTPSDPPPVIPVMLPASSPTPLESIDIPNSINRILRPGPLSKVTSPIRVEIASIAPESGTLSIELYGEDGRLLSQITRPDNILTGQKLNLNYKVYFEIPALSEYGRLQVNMGDFYGRVTSVSSVNLILLSQGGSEVNPPGDSLAPIYIQAPRYMEIITGGECNAVGYARRASDQTLTAELITDDGRILASKPVEIDPFYPGKHAHFNVKLPYEVNGTTFALLIIREPGDRIPGNQALSSTRVVLTP
jgi:hypothetical protein